MFAGLGDRGGEGGLWVEGRCLDGVGGLVWLVVVGSCGPMGKWDGVIGVDSFLRVGL